jgi:hypothetical protein
MTAADLRYEAGRVFFTTLVTAVGTLVVAAVVADQALRAVAARLQRKDRP